MRLFVAVPLRADLARALHAAAGDVVGRDRGWRLVRPENVHLTLRFLGDTPGERAEDLARTLDAPAAGASPHAIPLVQFGCFPARRRPRVLWVGPEKAPDETAALHAAVESWVRAHGAPPESRAFAPHLTLARARPGARAPELPSEVPGAPKLEVETIELVRSRLSSEGARYDTLAACRLGGMRSAV